MENQTLANAELAVMKLLWQAENPLTARDIREHLYPDKSKSQHGTIQRLLQRLEEKRFIERDKSIAVHFFAAAVSHQAYAGQQLEALADKLTAGSVAPLITHLFEQKRISKAEIGRLREVIKNYESENKRSSRKGKKQ